MTDGATSWSELAELRQGVYRFLCGGMLPPDAERFEALRAAAATLDASGIDDFAFVGAWRDVVEALDDPYDEVDQQYGTLFVTAAGAGTCPPLESSYGAAPGSAPLLEGSLRREYGELGVKVRPGLSVPTDHVSVQLEVMASLCHNEAHAWGEERDEDAVAALREQWVFLERHLGRWSPLWAAHVRKVAPDGLWRRLATAVEAFVEHDRDLITVLTRSRLASA